MTDYARVFAAALEVAGKTDRGLASNDPQTVREIMFERDLPERLYDDVALLANALVAFAMDVRAAERKGRPIIAHASEGELL